MQAVINSTLVNELNKVVFYNLYTDSDLLLLPHKMNLFFSGIYDTYIFLILSDNFKKQSNLLNVKNFLELLITYCLSMTLCQFSRKKNAKQI